MAQFERARPEINGRSVQFQTLGEAGVSVAPEGSSTHRGANTRLSQNNAWILASGRRSALCRANRWRGALLLRVGRRGPRGRSLLLGRQRVPSSWPPRAGVVRWLFGGSACWASSSDEDLRVLGIVVHCAYMSELVVPCFRKDKITRAKERSRGPIVSAAPDVTTRLTPLSTTPPGRRTSERETVWGQTLLGRPPRATGSWVPPDPPLQSMCLQCCPYISSGS